MQSTTQERVDSEQSVCVCTCCVDLVDPTDAVDRIKAIIAGETTNKQSSSQVGNMWG